MTHGKQDKVGSQNPQAREFIRFFKERKARIDKLYPPGTNPPVVSISLARAVDAFEANDLPAAREQVEKAWEQAEKYTYFVSMMFMSMTRHHLKLLGKLGLDVNESILFIKNAEDVLRQKDYTRAIRSSFKAVEALNGVSQTYKEAFMDLMKGYHDVFLAEPLVGSNLHPATKELEGGFHAIFTDDLEKANVNIGNARVDIDRETNRCKSISKKLVLVRKAVKKGRMMGADVGEAQDIHEEAIACVEKEEMETAEELLDKAMALAIAAGKDLVWDGGEVKDHHSS
jgi:hypothetical protein